MCLKVGLTAGLQPCCQYLFVDTQSGAEHSYHGSEEGDQNYLSLVLFLRLSGPKNNNSITCRTKGRGGRLNFNYKLVKLADSSSELKQNK